MSAGNGGGVESTVVWDSQAYSRARLRQAMEAQGHTGIKWDSARAYPRATCEHGCVGILIPAVLSYGAGLAPCRISPPSKTNDQGDEKHDER